MTNRRPDLVETSGGWEPHTSGGERLLVALASLALLGGLLIVGTNLLSHHAEISVASQSPLPTVAQVPTQWHASPQGLVITESTGPGGVILGTSVGIVPGDLGTDHEIAVFGPAYLLPGASGSVDPSGELWFSAQTIPWVQSGSGPGSRYQLKASKAGF